MQPSDDNYWRGNEEEDTAPLPASQPAPNETPLAPFEPISWEASEYIHHERDATWFAVFITVAILLIALSIFFLKNYFFTALIVVMSVALFLYARRPPRVLHYILSAQGLTISQKFHPFSEFRAFGVVQDGPLFSVRLLPTARFGQVITVYFAENDGERIVDILGAYLPMEDLRLDLIDVILRRLRL